MNLPQLGSRLILVNPSQFNTVTKYTPRFVDRPFTAENGVTQQSGVYTDFASTCLILGGNTGKNGLTNLYHLDPEVVNPLKAATLIGVDLQELAQETGQPVNTILTGGIAFNELKAALIEKPSKKALKHWLSHTSAGEKSMRLYDSLRNMLERSPVTKEKTIISGRKSKEKGGFTGLAIPKDGNYYLKASLDSDSGNSVPITTEKGLKKAFKQIKYGHPNQIMEIKPNKK